MELYDTTLRDGAQNPDVRFSAFDKLKILQVLDSFGIDYVELGWPGSNDADMQCFLKAAEMKLKAKVVAFGSTMRSGILAAEDPNLKAIVESRAKYSMIFGKTIVSHIEKQLKTNKEENLKLIAESVAFLRKNGITVFYAAEHFFDGYKEDPTYALKCMEAAATAGAETIVLCDTNGGTLPHDFCSIMKELQAKWNGRTKLSVHLHNDSGCAVANSLLAVDYGVLQIQGTINGFGERAGNADLCQIIPSLVLKKQIQLNLDLTKLKELSETVYSLANVKPNRSQPYVGSNAFSHKGGVHVDALLKGASYEHIMPELVGNVREYVVSELSGKSSVIEMLQRFGVKAEKSDKRVDPMLAEIKDMEQKGYGINSIEAEKFLLVRKHFSADNGLFSIKQWRVTSEDRGGEYSECVVVGMIDGKQKDAVGRVEGGPVDALYSAIRKLVGEKYSAINNVKLINYKVMIAEDKGAASTVRVYIMFSDGSDEWATAGVSENILKASVEAIEKGFRYCVVREN
jgi:2-isopropylmalate synthase